MVDLGVMIALALFAAMACSQTPGAGVSTPTVEARTAGTPGTADPCEEHLELLVSAEEGRVEERALVTSYQCLTRYVDSTGRYPPDTPSLAFAAGEQLVFRMASAQLPVKLEIRLYSGAGLYGDFLKWPEDLPGSVQAMDTVRPDPSTTFEYLPQRAPGDYSLVIRAVWDSPRDVFYAVGFTLE